MNRYVMYVTGIGVLFAFLFVVPRAMALSFTDLVMTPGSTGYEHLLDDGDFSPPLSGGEPIVVDTALLTVEMDGTTGSFDSPAGLFGFSIVTTTGDNIFIGNFSFFSDQPNTTLANQVMEFDLSSNGSVMAMLNQDRSIFIDLIVDPAFGGAVTVNSSTLAGTATIIPEPASLALLGSGIIVMAARRRRRR